jgi:hypothetical protein
MPGLFSGLHRRPIGYLYVARKLVTCLLYIEQRNLPHACYFLIWTKA